MGKSYRKYPVIRQERVDKKYANKRIRQTAPDYALKGGQFKKLVVVTDWHYRWSMENAIRKYHEDADLHHYYQTLEDYLNYWKSCAVRK